MSEDVERTDRSLALFVFGYLVIFGGWCWWALRSGNPLTAVVFVLPLFLLEIPVFISAVAAMWLIAPPRRVRAWLYGAFLVFILVELSIFGDADANVLSDIANLRLDGLAWYGARIGLLTLAFFCSAWVARRR